MATTPFHNYRTLLADKPLPCAVVDLDALDRNIDRVTQALSGHPHKLRLATKSVRVPDLVERIAKRTSEVFAGLMTYTAAETLFWAQKGYRDLLLAYPTARPLDAALLVAANALSVAAVVVDDQSQLEVLALAAVQAGIELPVVIDLDVSWRLAGNHLGVRRSPLREPDAVVALAATIATTPGLRLHGLQAYEAQIAGMTDTDPRLRWENPLRRLLKAKSMPDVMLRRQRVVQALHKAGHTLQYVNGGGTGSLPHTLGDPTVTEVAVGSGFLGSGLFSHYAAVQPEPALCFALQVVRKPAPGLVTCHGGGLVASGAMAADRLPQPLLPAGLHLLSMEGAGEVQTPLQVPADVALQLGDPVLFCHAKAGELAEHFNDYALLRAGALVGRAKTYRGLGLSFLG